VLKVVRRQHLDELRLLEPHLRVASEGRNTENAVRRVCTIRDDLFDLGDEPETWEKQKLQESNSESPSILDGLPPSLPALLMAYRLQERAAGVGFDWPDTKGPRAKVAEELAELDHEMHDGRDAGRVESEIGDLLFSIINLARKIGCDPRAALEKANQKFDRRFRQVERLAVERNIDVGRASLEELDVLWEEAKQSG